MDFQQSVEIQAALEGVALPASKQQLLAYARREDPDRASALQSLPDREYRTLDEVGEALASVQPRAEPEAKLPRDESGEPPGGDSYTDPHPEPGRIRPDLQAERQKQLG